MISKYYVIVINKKKEMKLSDIKIVFGFTSKLLVHAFVLCYIP